MIGIIGAMDIEIEEIRKSMINKETKKISGIEFVKGELGNNEVVTAICGIGKVFAAICTETMIIEYNPDFIINTGIAGGLAKGIKIGDIVIADKAVQHDMDTSPLGDPKGLISGINKVYFESDRKISELLKKCVEEEGKTALYGTVATGDQFIASKEKKNFITEKFGAAAAEMEGGAIAQTCYVNDKPFAILRAISDSAEEGAISDYPRFRVEAAATYVNVIKRFAKLYK